MATNTRIKVLKLNKVMIKDSFAETMGKSLATNTTLEVLALESNSITGVGIIALANGFKTNKTLKELKLQGQEKSASTEAENVRRRQNGPRRAALRALTGQRTHTLELRVDRP